MEYSRSRSRSHSPHLKHDNIYLSPKRVQKTPPRTTTAKSSKHAFHVTRAESPHNSRSSKKSSRRSKYSHSPSRNIYPRSRSSSPVKDSRSNTKNVGDSPGYHSSVSKRKKPKSSPNNYNSKVKLSETSLFAELVKDRQMRELAMKCLTQINTKFDDDNEVVEIIDDSDNGSNTKTQTINDVKINVSEDKCELLKPKNDTPNFTSELIPTILENQNPSVSKIDVIENGIEHSLESISVTPLETTKIVLPLPPIFTDNNQISPDSEIKCLKKSIKDLPLPPGKFFFNLIFKTLYSFVCKVGSIILTQSNGNIPTIWKAWEQYFVQWVAIIYYLPNKSQ